MRQRRGGWRPPTTPQGAVVPITRPGWSGVWLEVSQIVPTTAPLPRRLPSQRTLLNFSGFGPRRFVRELSASMIVSSASGVAATESGVLGE